MTVIFSRRDVRPERRRVSDVSWEYRLLRARLTASWLKPTALTAFAVTKTPGVETNTGRYIDTQSLLRGSDRDATTLAEKPFALLLWTMAKYAEAADWTGLGLPVHRSR